MVKKTEVDVTLSQLIGDLAQGHTWLAKDDEGYGSIQAKYKADDIEILTIKKHPKLAGIEPSITILRIIDDLDGKPTVESNSVATKPAQQKPTVPVRETPKPVVPVVTRTITTMDNDPESSSQQESEDSFDSL